MSDESTSDRVKIELAADGSSAERARRFMERGAYFMEVHGAGRGHGSARQRARHQRGAPSQHRH